MVVPSTPCVGNTREAIGSAACQPVGDCEAPFPPAGATLFVDDDGPLDPTHFRTLREAVAAAPEGAVIAVEAGRYSGAHRLSRTVTLRGRCAERVQIDNPSAAGLVVQARAVISGVRVTASRWGIAVLGGDLTLEDSVVEDNVQLGIGLERGARARIERSVIRRTRLDANGEFGVGVGVNDASTLSLVDSAVSENHYRGCSAPSAGSVLRVERSVVRGTRRDGLGEGGEALAASAGGRLEVQGSVVLDNEQGIVALGSGTVAQVSEVLLDRPAGSVPEHRALLAQGATLSVTNSTITGAWSGGVAADDDARVQLRDVTIVGTVGPGGAVSSDNRASVDLSGAALVENLVFGVSATRSSVATVRDSLVHATRSSPASIGFGLVASSSSRLVASGSTVTETQGLGVMAWEARRVPDSSSVELSSCLIRSNRAAAPGSNVAVGIQSATARLTDTAVLDSEEAAIGVSSGGALVMQGGLVSGSRSRPDGSFGYGLILDGETSMEVTDTEFSFHPGVAVAVAGGRGTFRRGALVGNAIAIQVFAGTTLEAAESLAPPTAPVLQVSPSTTFSGNRVRSDTAVIPLPRLPQPPR